MYQTIHEPIEVAGVFSQAAFRPARFRWSGRSYSVEEVTYLGSVRDGAQRFWQYSVVSSGTVYRLRFQPQDLQWFLEEVWCEG